MSDTKQVSHARITVDVRVAEDEEVSRWSSATANNDFSIVIPTHMVNGNAIGKMIETAVNDALSKLPAALEEARIAEEKRQAEYEARRKREAEEKEAAKVAEEAGV